MSHLKLFLILSIDHTALPQCVMIVANSALSLDMIHTSVGTKGQFAYQLRRASRRLRGSREVCCHYPGHVRRKRVHEQLVAKTKIQNFPDI